MFHDDKVENACRELELRGGRKDVARANCWGEWDVEGFGEVGDALAARDACSREVGQENVGGMCFQNSAELIGVVIFLADADRQCEVARHFGMAAEVFAGYGRFEPEDAEFFELFAQGNCTGYVVMPGEIDEDIDVGTNGFACGFYDGNGIF